MKQSMTFEEFRDTLRENNPPVGMDPLLTALWYDGKGNWEEAHNIAQQANTPRHCQLHAYLHRKEGDKWNANYWYTRAGKKMPGNTLDEEWENLVKEWL